MSELRVLLWGAGKSGRLFGPSLSTHPDIRLDGIASSAGHSARNLAGALGARSLPAGTLLPGSPVNLIVIATPHHLHIAQAVEAMRAGAHVLLEKPLVLSRDDLRALLAAQERYQRRVFCAFVQRCSQEMTECRDYLAARVDEIQGVVVDQMLWRDEDYYRSWKGDPISAGGGVLANQAIHALDLALYLTAAVPIRVLCATTRRPGLQVEDTVSAMIDMSAGWPLMLSASTRVPVHGRQVVRINLSDCTVLVVGTEDPAWCVSEGMVEADIARLAAGEDELGPGHNRLVADVVHAILTGGQSQYHCELPGVLAAHHCMYAMYASAHDQQSKEVRYP